MKNALKIIGAYIVAAIKKVLGKKDEVVIQLPDNLAISTEDIDKCIHVVNVIKDWVNNPVVVFLTDLTPTGWDGWLRDKFDEVTIKILAGLTFSKRIASNPDREAALNELIATIRFADDADKDSLYHSIAARFIVAISDGKVTWSEAASIVEPYFKQLYLKPTKH